MKTCSKCKVAYPEPISDFFNRKKGSPDGFQYNCKSCLKLFHQEHYQARKGYYKEKAVGHNKVYRKRNLQLMVDYLKEHPCVDCGERDPIVLEFDHQKDKEYNVSAMNTSSLSTLQKEIEKCEVRCSNCHRRKTAKQFGYYRGIQL